MSVWHRASRRRGTLTRRHQSSWSHLEIELPQRLIPPVFEDMSNHKSYRLDVILADLLPDSVAPLIPSPARLKRELPLAHHICYFEPSRQVSQMLPDGTNPDHSPGDAFPRRMWAGGRVAWNLRNPLRLDSETAVSAEFIRSVSIKGRKGDEKVFVEIERRLAKATADEQSQLVDIANTTAPQQAFEELQHRVRQRLWRDSDSDFGPASIIDTRNIVFLQERTKVALPDQQVLNEPNAPVKILMPQRSPDYIHKFMPTPLLLFRFSALTFNAHSIHLDPRYAQDVEGHRALLLHGPLSFVITMALLQRHLTREGLSEQVRSIEYRNLAPLYCGEEATFCGARVGERKWEVWAQTPDGGVAVRGIVKTQ